MSVGRRIYELRSIRDIKRADLAKAIGVTVGAISNYENGVSFPKEPILFRIMNTLECDANYLFQDYMSHKINFAVNAWEHKLLKKYDRLDTHGKEMVDITLDKEWERSVLLAEEEEHMPIAAHSDDDSPEELEKLKRDMEDL